MKLHRADDAISTADHVSCQPLGDKCLPSSRRSVDDSLTFALNGGDPATQKCLIQQGLGGELLQRVFRIELGELFDDFEVALNRGKRDFLGREENKREAPLECIHDLCYDIFW